MPQGDHLVVRHSIYTHHAIDMGDGRVIHYGQGLHDKRNASVEIISRANFAAQGPVSVRHQPASYSANVIIQRAHSRLGECNYDLFENNCEHFVNWCRTGTADSSQVNTADCLCRRGGAAAAKVIWPRTARRVADRCLVGKVASKAVGRWGLAASLAGDAVQLSAEVVAIRCGQNLEQTQRIGQGSGALASGGLGFMLGGPAGAAAGVSSWLFGEVMGQKTASGIRRFVRR